MGTNADGTQPKAAGPQFDAPEDPLPLQYSAPMQITAERRMSFVLLWLITSCVLLFGLPLLMCVVCFAEAVMTDVQARFDLPFTGALVGFIWFPLRPLWNATKGAPLPGEFVLAMLALGHLGVSAAYGLGLARLMRWERFRAVVMRHRIPSGRLTGDPLWIVAGMSSATRERSDMCIQAETVQDAVRIAKSAGVSAVTVTRVQPKSGEHTSR